VRALSLQRKLSSLAGIFTHGYWISAMKAALQMRGFDIGSPSQPLEACRGLRLEALKILDRSDDSWLISPSRREGDGR
jgi:dihydrodipicolinate synthase/N-acetylneuraminate lyase